MAVTCHLGYYRTGNSAIRSADPENPCLEPDMEWIGCTVCEIFAFKLYCALKLGFGVTQGHQKQHHSIEHIVTMPLSLTVSEIGRKSLPPLYLAPSLGVTPSDLHNDPCWRKTRLMGLSDTERISMIRSAVLIQYARVTDGQTDGWNWSGIYTL